MLSPDDYWDTKRRLLIATELLHQVCTSPDTVRYDEQYYPIVLAAGLSAKEDIRKVLAELDILRAKFTEGILPEVINAEAKRIDTAGTVRSVPPQEDVGSGDGERDVNAAASGDAAGDGADGESASRSNPKRNRRPRRRNKKDAVGRGDAAGTVGGSKDS